MNIVQLTPGAGAMYCGNCFRDNALVAELRRQGHDVIMVPLYLPLTLDEEDQSADTPVFFGGINVYLDQKWSCWKRVPGFLNRLLSTRGLLEWAGGRAAKTKASELGELTLSMLRGEEGRQARELEDLIAWLKQQGRPDVVCFSNALLLGMARRIKAELQTAIVCTLQGEDGFLDLLPESHREAAWQLVTERAADVDLFIAPSRYFADVMIRRLKLPAERVKVVHNGINLEGYHPGEGQVTGDVNAADREIPTRGTRHAAPVLGYLARMCREKGLDTLVEAFIQLKQRGTIPRLKLHIAGSCGPSDEVFVKQLRKRLAEAGYIGETVFSPNISRAEKIGFLESLSVLSVPARYGEAYGLYVIEALAAGVPVVQPRVAAFPELVETTGGGTVCEPEDAKSLANALEALLLEPAHAQAVGQNGRKVVFERFSIEAMAEVVAKLFAELRWRR
jgi:glycosyltransferase involved in cell wall biosynthesis